MEITNVGRLNSIAKLEKEGFEGVDKGLEISLFEYSLAWKVLEESNEILFIYKIPNGNFDRCTFTLGTDVKKEFNWMKEKEWKSFLGFLGLDQEDFDGMPLAWKIKDLVSFYGYENIFGTSYWEGFEIKAE